MAIVYEDTLKKDISSKNFSSVYLLYGDDSYLKNYYKDTISEKSFDGDPFFNLQKFDSECDLQEVFDAVNQYPMMADRKCVVLYDYDFNHCSKSDFDKLCTLISNANDTCVLVLCFDTIDFDAKKGAKEKKLITATEKVGGKCAEINHRTTTALVKMLSDGAKKRGCRFGEIAARYLIEVSGSDLSTLKNELEKLCAFTSEGEITKDTVDTVSVKSVDASVYDYVKQVFSGNVSEALKLLDGMFFMHIEPIAILYNIASPYVDMYRMFAANKLSVSKNDVAKDFAYPKNRQFLLDRASQNLKKFDFKKLNYSLNALVSADKQLKTFGGDARNILEQLTVKLIYIIAKGEPID